MFYLELFRVLGEHDVRYLLVGGVAMNLHGVPRMTMDVDLMLALGQENLSCFVRACGQLNLQPVLPVPLSDFLDSKKRADWFTERHMIAFALRGNSHTTPTVDILINPGISFDIAYARRLIRNVGDTQISLAHVSDLIELKSAANREQDQADIAHLRKLSGNE